MPVTSAAIRSIETRPMSRAGLPRTRTDAPGRSSLDPASRWIAIGIAGGEDGDPRVFIKALSGAVADRLARRGIADLHDPRLRGDDGRERRLLANELRAIKRDSGPHQIEMGVRAEMDAGGIGERRRRVGNSARISRKRASCARFSGWSGSSAQARWLIDELGRRGEKKVRSARQLQRFVQRQAEPVHAGVDLDRRRLARRNAAPKPRSRQSCRAPGGARALRKASAQSGQKAVEDIDGGVRAQLRARGGLPPAARRRRCGSPLRERRHRRFDADAVGVRLDDGGAFGGRGEGGEAYPVPASAPRSMVRTSPAASVPVCANLSSSGDCIKSRCSCGTRS